MSLKAFHIFFITVSTLLTVFVAWYALTSMTGSTQILWVIGCIMSMIALVFYGRYFLKKMKDVSYL